MTQHLIIGVTIKSGQVKALMLNIIHDIGKGQQMQLVPLQLRGGRLADVSVEITKDMMFTSLKSNE